MKIHLQSDLHIEMGAWQAPTVSSDVVVAAGDIGLLCEPETLSLYFEDVWKTTDNIIWVLGNHEFYHSDYRECLEIAAKFAKEHGIILMDEALGTDNLVLDGVTFWGSTLWTDFKTNDWFVKNKVDRNFNDFDVITNGRDPNADIGVISHFTAEDSRIINERTRAKINWDADVIITHHCPVMIEHRRFPISDITYGFCNDTLEDKINESKVKFWLYGHTHDSHYLDYNGTAIVSNQQGYPMRYGPDGSRDYEPTGGFDTNLILEIPSNSDK